MKPRLVLAVAAFAAAASLAPATSAQEGPVTFEFSFSNPGARSMGLGGAFAALADDATAAFANPAGLVQLIEPEISVEGRSWSYDTPFIQGGRASGSPSGIGVDTASGIRRGTSSSEQTGFSFASFVYPGDGWALAVYRHTWADFDLDSRVDGLFAVVDGEDERSEDVRATTSVEVVNSGVALAFELGERFSVGVGGVHYEAKLDSFTGEFAQDDDDFYERNDFDPELLDTAYSHRADDDGFVVHAGLLWRPSDRWSLGAHYRQGPELAMRVIEIVGPGQDELPVGTVELDVTTPFKLPDTWGAGVAYRHPDGSWTLSFEWTRVEYSSITESLDTEVFDADQLALEDGDEYHLGLEYVFVRSRPIVALRLGAWHDPAHSLGSGPTADVFESAIFQTGDDEIHATAGLGVVFGDFQLDLGADLSDTADVVSLSFVYRF
ncbi:MAG TPA: outer membrane protein transport protein [Thermoanaerobaculia bacterium]|nr:outer membrane protein transport protein [Thermoanaerobaculia bacterium]